MFFKLGLNIYPDIEKIIFEYYYIYWAYHFFLTFWGSELNFQTYFTLPHWAYSGRLIQEGPIN